MTITITITMTIYCVRKLKGRLGKIPKTFESRQLKDFNKEMFIQDLSRVYWDDLVGYDDPNLLTCGRKCLLAVSTNMHHCVSERVKIHTAHGLHLT